MHQYPVSFIRPAPEPKLSIANLLSPSIESKSSEKHRDHSHIEEMPSGKKSVHSATASNIVKLSLKRPAEAYEVPQQTNGIVSPASASNPKRRSLERPTRLTLEQAGQAQPASIPPQRCSVPTRYTHAEPRMHSASLRHAWAKQRGG